MCCLKVGDLNKSLFKLLKSSIKFLGFVRSYRIFYDRKCTVIIILLIQFVAIGFKKKSITEPHHGKGLRVRD